MPGELSNPNPIVAAIYKAMVDKGMNPTSLAKEVGANPTYFRDLFRSRSQRPSGKFLPKIVSALGLDITAIINPGAADRQSQSDSEADEPEQIAILSFWRLLSKAGKARVMRAIVRELEDDLSR
jgi:hypothetical protein